MLLCFVFISEVTCVNTLVSASVPSNLLLISNPGCLVAPEMNLLFIIIAATAFNLTDLLKEPKSNLVPVALL